MVSEYHLEMLIQFHDAPSCNTKVFPLHTFKPPTQAAKGQHEQPLTGTVEVCHCVSDLLGLHLPFFSSDVARVINTI